MVKPCETSPFQLQVMEEMRPNEIWKVPQMGSNVAAS